MAEKSAVNHPIFARFFDRLSEKKERLGQAEHRHQLLAGLSGRVIEVGAGNGLNFKSYPPEVTHVLAVEPESYLRERAREAAAGRGRDPAPADLHEPQAGEAPVERLRVHQRDPRWWLGKLRTRRGRRLEQRGARTRLRAAAPKAASAPTARTHAGTAWRRRPARSIGQCARLTAASGPGDRVIDALPPEAWAR